MGYWIEKSRGQSFRGIGDSIQLREQDTEDGYRDVKDDVEDERRERERGGGRLEEE